MTTNLYGKSRKPLREDMRHARRRFKRQVAYEGLEYESVVKNYRGDLVVNNYTHPARECGYRLSDGQVFLVDEPL